MYKFSSVLISDQSRLQISSSFKGCLGHMAAAASAAATTSGPAAETAAADDPNTQTAKSGWRPKCRFAPPPAERPVGFYRISTTKKNTQISTKQHYVDQISTAKLR